MKYLNFSKSYPVEDINGGYIVGDNGESVSVPFEIFIKGIILMDDRWGKSVKLLTMLMDIREKVKELSYNDNKDNKILELTDDEWQICVNIVEEPQAGFNVTLASALMKHIKDLKEASSLPLKFE